MKILLFESLTRFDPINEILTLDRNFITLKGLSVKQINFCICFSAKNFRFAKPVMEQEGNDFITDWNLRPKERENSKKNGLDCHSLKARVTKVQFTTRETELLVSSLLDTETHPALFITNHDLA